MHVCACTCAWQLTVFISLKYLSDRDNKLPSKIEQKQNNQILVKTITKQDHH